MKQKNQTPFQFGQPAGDTSPYLFSAERGHSCPQQCVSPTMRRTPQLLIPSEAAADRNVRAPQTAYSSPAAQRGHTLAEVMVAMGVLGLMVVSLFAGISSGFDVVRVARENLRATQILEERMEVIRLIKWDNVTPGFIPTTFSAPFYAADATNTTAGGF